MLTALILGDWAFDGVKIALFLVLMFIGLSNDINRLGGG